MPPHTPMGLGVGQEISLVQEQHKLCGLHQPDESFQIARLALTASQPFGRAALPAAQQHQPRVQSDVGLW